MMMRGCINFRVDVALKARLAAAGGGNISLGLRRLLALGLEEAERRGEITPSPPRDLNWSGGGAGVQVKVVAGEGGVRVILEIADETQTHQHQTR